MLMLTTGTMATPTLMEATEPMDTATPMLTMVSTTARGLLRLSLRPMLRLTPGTPMVPTDWATPVTTDSATEPMDTATPMLTMVFTTARGLLRLSLRPRLRLTPTTTVPTDWDTPATTDLATEPMVTPMLTMAMLTTARGPLMLSLSQRLMLMLTTGTTAMVPGPTTDMVWDTEDTALATGAITGDKFSVLRSTKQKL